MKNQYGSELSIVGGGAPLERRVGRVVDRVDYAFRRSKRARHINRRKRCGTQIRVIGRDVNIVPRRVVVHVRDRSAQANVDFSTIDGDGVHRKRRAYGSRRYVNICATGSATQG